MTVRLIEYSFKSDRSPSQLSRPHHRWHLTSSPFDLNHFPTRIFIDQKSDSWRRRSYSSERRQWSHQSHKWCPRSQCHHTDALSQSHIGTQTRSSIEVTCYALSTSWSRFVRMFVEFSRKILICTGDMTVQMRQHNEISVLTFLLRSLGVRCCHTLFLNSEEFCQALGEPSEHIFVIFRGQKKR